MEVVRGDQLLTVGGVEGINDPYRQDLVAQIGEIAGYDRTGHQQTVQIRAGELDEVMGIPDFHRSEVGTVDDRREAESLALVVFQVGEAIKVLHDPAEFHALWVGLEDLPQRHLPAVIQGYETGAVRIGGPVVHREFHQIRPVDPHGDGAALAPEVPA